MGNKVIQLSQNKEIVTLDIEGMTCAACAVRIEKVIQKNTPESIVNVSFPLKTAELELDTSKNINELIAKIEKIGYKAKVHEEQKAMRDEVAFFILNCNVFKLQRMYQEMRRLNKIQHSTTAQSGQLFLSVE